MLRAFPAGLTVPHTPEAAVIGLFWATFFVVWLAAAWFTKRTVERSGSAYGIFGVVALIAVYTAGKANFADVALWQYSQAAGLAADAIAGLGLFMMLWARATLGRNWSGEVTFKENHELITTGPYALARHPIYTGMLLMMFGTAILIGHSSAFAFAVLVTVLLWFKARVEERLMTKHFPDAYPAYKSRVRALIPFVL